MDSVIILSAYQLATFYLLLVIPLVMLWWLKLGTVARDLIVSVGRMTIQLGLIALYLEFLFRLNSLWVNLLWLLIMVTVANLHILKRGGVSGKPIFLITQFSLMTAVVVSLSAMLLFVAPEPWYDARYIIPLTGMLLGNSLTANTLVLERFYTAIENQRERFMGDLLLGATVTEATAPIVRESIQAALTPTIATMATLGIVYLPGMMTGQILGGVEPFMAVAYQALIMVGIAVSTVISTVMILMLSVKVSFDGFGIQDSAIAKSRLAKRISYNG